VGAVLVVDDDEGARRLLARFLRQQRPVRAAATAEEAIAQIGAHDDWAGFLVDVSLGSNERGGLDVLSAARRVFPSVPAAVVSASTDRDVINRATALSASYICKPFGAEELTAFLLRVTAADTGLDDALENRLAELSRRWGLLPRESDLLAWLVAGKSREAYVERAGITTVVWRSAIGGLLAKAGYARTGDLVLAVLREELRARTQRRGRD